MAATKSGPAQPFSQEEIDAALSALVAWAGNATAAVRYLKTQDRRTPAAGTLLEWSRTLHWERYEQIREQWSQQVEQTVTNDLRDAARAAVEATRLAVEQARKKLEAGKDDDPARSAANLARVTQTATEKLLSLTGRPTQITENRDVNAVIRSLAAMGVITIPDEPAQIESETEAEKDA